jgi:hypothetical protein
VAAVQAGRPADAVARFECSCATRTAREWYDRFLATARPEDLARHEGTVRAHLVEVTRRLARASADDASPTGARMLLDGALFNAQPRWIEAGEQRAEAEAAGHVPSRLTLTVAAGEVLHLDAALAPVVAPTSVTHRWWFWTAVGVAVAGVTAAVLVPVLGSAAPAAHPDNQRLP